ncbi:MAG: hypothetical protein N3A68_00480 [Bacteroidia bacterium]|nr:hypothetical protein [Bacteroidia bacterium]GIV23649.1 MAG: hypothetical protein KatS3mg025_1308 [Bacteroidia bacterium]
MPYSPEEYEELKEFYKRELRERKELQEKLRQARLRLQAQWHLQQMEASLRSLGIEPSLESSQLPETPQASLPPAPPPPNDSSDNPPPAEKTLL